MALYSVRETKGLPVMNRSAKCLLGKMDAIFFSPETGKCIGMLVGRTFRKKIIICAEDIIGITAGRISVQPELGTSCHKELLNRKLYGPHIMGQKVVTEQGMSLGTVKDIMFDGTELVLNQVYVEARLLGIVRTKAYMISWNDILEVTPLVIVVRDAFVWDVVSTKKNRKMGKGKRLLEPAFEHYFSDTES